ncbi:MAG: hypothetical protein WDW38_006044 [Sanguina aurantia]
MIAWRVSWLQAGTSSVSTSTEAFQALGPSDRRGTCAARRRHRVRPPGPARAVVQQGGCVSRCAVAAADIFQGYGMLVTVLVGVHVVAFVAWIGLLVFGNRDTKSTTKRD